MARRVRGIAAVVDRLNLVDVAGGDEGGGHGDENEVVVRSPWWAFLCTAKVCNAVKIISVELLLLGTTWLVDLMNVFIVCSESRGRGLIVFLAVVVAILILRS